MKRGERGRQKHATYFCKLTIQYEKSINGTCVDNPKQEADEQKIEEWWHFSGGLGQELKSEVGTDLGTLFYGYI